MLFGFRRTTCVASEIRKLTAEISGLRTDVQTLQDQVKMMTSAQDQVTADIALIKSEIGTMAANYSAAAAAALQPQIDAAKAAWDANDDAAWNTAHTALQAIQATIMAGQPITPPATSANPSPTPVAAPAPDGSTPTPSAPSSDPAATPAPADTVAPAPAATDGNGTAAAAPPTAS